MPDLSSFHNTREIISKHNFSIQKKYGQNFLIDGRVLDKIIEAAELSKNDYVIEIGPGLGTMTQRMAPLCKHVTAIEIDKELIPILSDTLSDFDNVDVINDDVLKVDFRELIEKKNEGKPIKIVANLPYYITTPIIMELLEEKLKIKSITVMVQKEVADRMKVGPGTKDYGALSLAVKYYASPYIVANVPQNCFIPRPNVASAVIRLNCHEKPPVSVKDEKLMFSLIRAAFNQRRKTLINAVSNYTGLSFTKEDVASALSSIGLDENIRGEVLDLEKFAMLTDRLLESK